MNDAIGDLVNELTNAIVFDEIATRFDDTKGTT